MITETMEKEQKYEAEHGVPLPSFDEAVRVWKRV
jgi:hypothetical protein